MSDRVCLRKITRRLWIREADEPAPSWCLKDMTQNFKEKLSVYLFPADQADAIAPLVAAAIRSQAEGVYHSDYLLFDESFLGKASLTVEETPGDTPIDEVNLLHAEIDATAQQAAHLATLLYADVQPMRLHQKRVLEVLVAAKKGGKINLSKADEKVRAEVEAAAASA